MDAKERGKKTLEGLIADPKCPADKKAAYQAMLADDYLCEQIGGDGLRQDEFSRSMGAAQAKWNAAEDWKRKLDGWHQENQAALEEGKQAKSRLAELETTGGGRTINPDGSPGGVATAPAFDPSKYSTREALDAAKAEAIQYATAYGAHIARLVVQHGAEFGGEVLDTDALIKFCRERGFALDRGGYDAFVYERRTEKHKQDQDKALKDAEQRGFERGLAESSSAPPYPISGGVGANESQTLAGLNPDNKGKFGVAAAVATYNNEIRKKLGVGA